MRYFDTSVLVAALIEGEAHHESCVNIVSKTSGGCVLAHGMAECFSILTGGRLPVQLSANMASELIEINIERRMKIVTLTPKETLTTLKSAESLGIRGGGVYDALHLVAARKVDAEEIFTLNLRHFQAFAPDLESRIRKP